jgi:divalent metal cation (Fe/Co/Zn/Cd) transporter
VDGRGRRDRDYRRRPRRFDRADLVRARLGDRGLRQPRHRLALHGLAAALAQKLVAIQFFLLAPYVAFEAVHKLVTGEQPQTSWLGIVLVTSSAIGMPFLGVAKRRLADKLGSVATRGEGTQNLLCAYLAAAVLVGLLGNALLGFWWLDPAAALVVAAVAVKEGRESWRGEGCCASC